MSYTSIALATDYDCWKLDNQVVFLFYKFSQSRHLNVSLYVLYSLYEQTTSSCIQCTYFNFLLHLHITYK